MEKTELVGLIIVLTIEYNLLAKYEILLFGHQVLKKQEKKTRNLEMGLKKGCSYNKTYSNIRYQLFFHIQHVCSEDRYFDDN